MGQQMCLLLLLAIYLGQYTIFSKAGNKDVIPRGKNKTLPAMGVDISTRKRPLHPVNTVRFQTQTMATLKCRLPKIYTEALWFKRSNTDQNDDTLMITRNSSTVIIDQRFQAKNNSMNYMLNIRLTQKSDEGLYECQIRYPSGKPSRTHVNLVLIEAYAHIINGNFKIVKAGFPLRLSCVLNNSIAPTTYIYWYHGDRVINYDLDDGATVREGRQGSELIFPMAEPKHAGNYSCVPSNAKQANVIVEVNLSDTATPDPYRDHGCTIIMSYISKILSTLIVFLL